MQLTVHGQATAAFPPERATVHLALGFEGSDSQQVLAATTALATEVASHLAALRSQQPSPTTWSAVLAIGTRSWRPYSQDGVVLPLRHAASCEVKVKFRDFAALSRFIDAWGGREGVSVGAVEWTLTEASRVREEDRVLARAVEAARYRAQTMATAAGSGQVRFLEVADPGLLDRGAQTEAASFAMSVRGKGAAGGEGVSLVPEDVELQASVHARFAAES